MNESRKPERSPALIIIAVIMIGVGVLLAILGVVYFTALGWAYALPIIIGGLSSASMALTALITGKAEWILLDLIIPG